MARSLHRRLLLVAIALAALVSAPTAHADADPASDFLISQDIFVPFGNPTPADRRGRLEEIVRRANLAGYRIKVAVVGTRPDLGGVAVLYLNPGGYAHFLGQELTYWYRGRLLIVMPNGYGLYWGPRRLERERKALLGLGAPGSVKSSTLVDSAVVAVKKLAALDGHKLVLPRGAAGGQGKSNSELIAVIAIGLILATLVVLVSALAYVRWRRNARGRAAST